MYPRNAIKEIKEAELEALLFVCQIAGYLWSAASEQGTEGRWG